jgi:hypothetical protein
MNKFMGKAGMILIAWMVGSGSLWADQTAPESLPQNAEAVSGQVSANEKVPSLGSPSDSAGTKSQTKSIKISDGSSQKSSKKTKKSSTKKPKKSKSAKSKKKSKALSEIDSPSEIG